MYKDIPQPIANQHSVATSSTDTGQQLLPSYLPELDGLRACAVIAVLGFHAGLPGFRYGWVGLNLFFVLSGFLITGILLDAKNTCEGWGYFRAFYARRTLRIFPIYYASLLLVSVFALIYQAPRKDFLYYLIYTQNFVIGRTDFAPSFLGMMNHTWSLAVEEQFYLCWPFVVYFLRRQMVFLCLSFLAVAPAFRWYIASGFQINGLVFTLLPGNLDSLGAGALLAVIIRQIRSPKMISDIFLLITSLAGLAIISFGFTFGYPPSGLFLSMAGQLLYSLLPYLFAGCLIVPILHTNYAIEKIAAFLRLDPLRYIGKISYGLYLYHLPVYFACSAILPHLVPHDTYGKLATASLVFSKLLLTFLVSLISWHFFESRINSLKVYFSYSRGPYGKVSDARAD